MSSEVYDNYLGGEIVTRADAYEVLVGPWRTMIPVVDGDWLRAHDQANNWRLRKAEKLRSQLQGRQTVPVDLRVLPRLLKEGYGPFLCRDELKTDRPPGAAPSFKPDVLSRYWDKDLDVQAQQADETHRAHAQHAAFAVTEWGALSGRPLERLAFLFNRTDIGNLAYMCLHAPPSQRLRFLELYERLLTVVQKCQ